MLTKDQTAKLRAWVIARAKAYVSDAASYDDTCFTAADAAAHVGEPAKSLPVYNAIEALELEDLIEWNRPSATPGYWRPTAKAAREVAS